MAPGQSSGAKRLATEQQLLQTLQVIEPRQVREVFTYLARHLNDDCTWIGQLVSMWPHLRSLLLCGEAVSSLNRLCQDMEELDLCFVVAQLWRQVVEIPCGSERCTHQVDRGGKRHVYFLCSETESMQDALTRLGQEDFWRIFSAGRGPWLNKALAFLLDDLLARGEFVIRHPDLPRRRLASVWVSHGRVALPLPGSGEVAPPEIVWHYDDGRMVRPTHNPGCHDLGCDVGSHHTVCVTSWLPDDHDGVRALRTADMSAAQFGLFTYLPSQEPFFLFSSRIFRLESEIETQTLDEVRAQQGSWPRVQSSLILAQRALTKIAEKQVVADGEFLALGRCVARAALGVGFLAP